MRRPSAGPGARSPSRCGTGSAAPPRSATARSRGDAVAHAVANSPGARLDLRREQLSSVSCRSRTRRPPRSPRPRRDRTRRRGSRAGGRTIWSGPRRPEAVARSRSRRHAGTPSSIEAEAVAVALEAKRFVEGVRAFALGVRRQHHLVAALLAASVDGKCIIAWPMPRPCARGIDHYILDDRRRRAEMAEIVHDQQREAADDAAVPLGDIERVVGIAAQSARRAVRPRRNGSTSSIIHPGCA